MDLGTPKIVAAIVSTILALLAARKVKRGESVTDDLTQDKPPPEADTITQPPAQAQPDAGRWLTIRADSSGAYKFKSGEVYRGSFEVMGAASWFDSKSAVESYARKFGLPLRTVKDLGGDRYQVETNPVPKTVRLEKHPAVRVEKIERWQVAS